MTQDEDPVGQSQGNEMDEDSIHLEFLRFEEEIVCDVPTRVPEL